LLSDWINSSLKRKRPLSSNAKPVILLGMIRLAAVSLLFSFGLLAASVAEEIARFKEGDRIVIKLNSGDKVRGKLVSKSTEAVVVSSKDAADARILLKDISEVDEERSGGSNIAIWIALGASFIGSGTAIGVGVTAKKKKEADAKAAANQSKQG
jgi:hypothetical protein